jgi:hypothetical protein
VVPSRTNGTATFSVQGSGWHPNSQIGVFIVWQRIGRTVGYTPATVKGDGTFEASAAIPGLPPFQTMIVTASANGSSRSDPPYFVTSQ